MISALFVLENSIYKTLGLDCWPESRDARLWPGGNVCICHPPCAQWGHLRGLAKKNDEERALALLAIKFVRENGGIVEHPSGSSLWKEMDLPVGKNYDSFGGFTVKLDQGCFGHKMKKTTLLYIVGLRRTNQALDHPVFQICAYKQISQLSKKQRLETPKDMAMWLINLAENCKKEIPGSR